MKINLNWLKRKKFWKRFLTIAFTVPIVLFSIVVAIIYVKQDELVQELITDLNKDFKGAAEIEDSHISMFANFPYISIDLENFKVFETKTKDTEPLINVKDAYLGFNLWTILSGKMEIKKIQLSSGHIDLIQHEDGSFNILKALSPEAEIEDTEEEFHLDLKKIELEDIDFTKLNEANGLKVETFINSAHSKFKTSGEHVLATMDADFVMNIIKNGDTTFFRHKRVDLDTHIDFIKGKDLMTIEPTTVHVQGAEFSMSGTIDFLKDMFLDLDFGVNKHNFDLFIAMMPEDLMHAMQAFDNEGDIFLKAEIIGRSINGYKPEIKASFGCKKGKFKNIENGKTLEDIAFKGYFSNGKDHKVESMELFLTDIHMRPGPGTVDGEIIMHNFKAPDVKLEANADLNLEFLSKFLSLEHIKDLSGSTKIDLSFHDVIDLEDPHKSLRGLNQKYKMKVALKNVQFNYDEFPVPFHDIDLIADLHGHEAAILKCDIKAGKSDLHFTGIIEDVPAIIHHTDIPVDTRLKIKSNFLDIYELTGGDSTAVDEQISNLSMDFDFKASAKSFTESKYLPKGEFFIEDLYAKFKHYPHTFHDFHADIFVEDRDLKVVDFSGMIDKSDFHFSGMLEHYEKWFDEHPGGDSRIEYDLRSDRLQMESLFTYKGENFIPEDYRHEEFDNLHVHGFTFLHYAEVLKSIDLTVDLLQAKMKIHPLRLEKFKGRIHYENDHLVIEDLHGNMGHSSFKTTLHYYLGDDPKTRLRDNHFSIIANRLDIDELINYNPPPVKIGDHPHVDHDAGFNIYQLPFTDMTYHMDIGQLNYHKHKFSNIKGDIHTTPNHYIYIDRLHLNSAGGTFDITGYFNGSDPNMIYMNPEIRAKNVDLDQLLLKFENFGQDYIVSENLHGIFSGIITGKIHVHNDLVPKIDDSEIHIDLDVIHGRLENYSLLHYMSDYFKDKNLNKVLFDTLNNHLDLVDGVMTIPAMKINSTLGHMEISGKQSLDGKMEYYLRIPWKMVSSTVKSKLFGREKSEEEMNQQVDEIQYGNEKTKYISVKIVGDENGYKFTIGKKKEKGK